MEMTGATDPELPAVVASMRRAGWNVVVASAGCDWYIRTLPAAAGLEVEIHANSGRFHQRKGLVMEMPTSSPFLSATLGVDVDRLRFSRADLAVLLRSDALPLQEFATWSDIAAALQQGGT
jgi:hypothetical protein